MTIPFWFWAAVTFVLGVNIGSFLNVVIYRVPIGGSLIEPKFSYCPNCKTQLTAVDLFPLFSFLLLGRRCRTCRKPISWRYFGVELLTGLLFLAVCFYTPPPSGNFAALILFTALLVPITFIDLDHFIIPPSLNLMAFAVAACRDIWGIVQHEPGHELVWGWLPRFVLGAAVGILIFGAVRILGWLWKGVEAMGLGDVSLARAMGAMLVSVVPAGMPPLRLFPMWVLFSCFAGIIVGPLLIWLRRKQAVNASSGSGIRQGESPPAVEMEQAEEEESSLILQIKDVAWYLWLGDLWEYVSEKRQGRNPDALMEGDDWQPAATAIPFGPFLAVGFMATVFLGEMVTRGYLAFALAKPH